MLPAAHSAAQLMQLTEAEAIRILHQHQGRVRNVDANFDHRCRDQHVDLPGDHLLHHEILVGGLHFSVDTADPELRKLQTELLRILHGGEKLLPAERSVCRGIRILFILHLRADDKDLTALAAQLPDECQQTRVVSAPDAEGIDGLPAGGKFVQRGQCQIPVDDQGQRAGDRGRRHDIDVGWERRC